MKRIYTCFYCLSILLALLSIQNFAMASYSAVVVQYHRFGESVHPSTNIRIEQFEAHLTELQNPKYKVLPLPEIFAFLSVYREAFPRLKKAGLPFTLFIPTQPVDRSINGYMSWKQIRELKRAGVTIGSQTHTHLHMAGSSSKKNKNELMTSNKRFKEELGLVPDIIAYPYGEYSLAVGEIAKAVGFKIGFGQHSGVIHPEADMMYLPRFSMNENYGGLSRFRLAINALPLPITDLSPSDPLLSNANNPPALGFTVKGIAATRLKKLACYTPSEGKDKIETLGARVEDRFQTAFPTGRTRINCTMRTRSGRWRWYGVQYYIPGQ